MQRVKLRAIYEKTKGRCWYCGAFHHPFDNWEIEHQDPRAQGGVGDIANLVLSCRACNAAKGNRTVNEYREILRARLLNEITSAREALDGLEQFVGWQRKIGSSGDILFPPDWLMEIDDCLLRASDQTVNSRFAFWAEMSSDPILSYESEPVIEAPGSIT